MSEGDGGLGVILMSERELQRIEVLPKVLERRMTLLTCHILPRIPPIKQHEA